MIPDCLRCGQPAEQVDGEPEKYWQHCGFTCRDEHLAELDAELYTAVQHLSQVRTARRNASRPYDTNERALVA